MEATSVNITNWKDLIKPPNLQVDSSTLTGTYGKFIADAPACIVVTTKDTRYFLEDGSAATTNILNAAHALGLGSCWVAGDKKPYASQILQACNAPADMKLISLIAIGYPAEVPQPTKRELDSVVHWETY